MPDRQLSSFQRKTDFVSLSDSFFTKVIPKIQDLAELKVILYVAYFILRKQERPHPDNTEITYKDLKAEIGRLSAGLDEKT